MNNKKIPIPPREELEALRSQGKTVQQIADIYFVSMNLVSIWLRKYGIQRKRRIDEYKYLTAARNGISRDLLRQRVYYHKWDVEEAINTPVMSVGERWKGRKEVKHDFK